MGSLRFELRSEHPERPRMVQATPRSLLIWVNIIDNLFLREKHATTTIPVQVKIIEDPFRFLSFFASALVLFINIRDYLSTGETANRYHTIPLIVMLMAIYSHRYDFWNFLRAPRP